MPWRLVVAPRAEKDIAGLSARDRDAVARALERVTADPGTVDFRKLAGRGDYWRVRVGRWRVIVRLDNAAGELHVVRVLARSDAYRD